MSVRKTKLSANNVHKLQKLWMYKPENMPNTIGDWENYLKNKVTDVKNVPGIPASKNISSVAFNNHFYVLVGLGLLYNNFEIFRFGFSFYSKLNNIRETHKKRIKISAEKAAKTLTKTKRASK